MMLRLAALVLLIPIVISGCGGSDDPTGPTTGTITINPEPNSIDAPWQVTGPGGYSQSGTGDTTLTDRAAGSYTLTWGSIVGQLQPSPVSISQTLNASETIVFTGVYLSVGDWVHCLPGTFTMGDESGGGGQHTVTLTQGFYMSKYEVTEQQWNEIMGGPPTTSQLPQAGESWDHAVQFCNALSDRQGLTRAYTIHGTAGDVTWDRGANGYRLPTEAEWEYACRAGSTTTFANGSITVPSNSCSTIDPVLDQIGWYCANSGNEPQVVGLKEANAWGLKDMHGNLTEWVWDADGNFLDLPPVDPVNDGGPYAYRVFRGGSAYHFAYDCRSAVRASANPYSGATSDGLRPVRTAN